MIFAFASRSSDVFLSNNWRPGWRGDRADALQRCGDRRDRALRWSPSASAGHKASAASAPAQVGPDHVRSIRCRRPSLSMLPVLISQLVVVLKDTAIGYQITSWRWSGRAR